MPVDVIMSSDASSSGTESLAKTKATFSSLWNNVKYEFNSKFRTKFNFDSPICLLGQLYHIKMSDSINYSDRKGSSIYVYEKFKHDFYSRIWLTYRKDFRPLLETNITTDSGWGCMVRSGQMLLAQALVFHLLGRDWRWEESAIDSAEEMKHRTIISWFADNPNCHLSPFSIHQIAKLGQKMGKKPGDWFGPASISFILKNALERVSKDNEYLQDICCYVAQDCTIYLQDVIDLCSSTDASESTWRSLFLMVPVRLGGECFNEIYASYLKEFLSLPFCLGIIGGKPRHSLYFVGFQEDKLVYLDPHYSQKTVDVTESDFPLDTYHCSTPRKVPLHSIDPSCTIGFYLKSKQELDHFIDCVSQIQERTRQAGDYPIFVLSRERNVPNELDHEMPEKVLRMKYRLVDSKGNVQKVINTEEFVLL